MPKSVSFTEKSDQNAVEELKKRECDGLLRLAYLGTIQRGGISELHQKFIDAVASAPDFGATTSNSQGNPLVSELN